ncbi:MAG TPA: hypothetical protein VF892_06845, partial [Pseudonocardiaceae bacterium]
MTEPRLTEANDWKLVVESRARRARGDLAALGDDPGSAAGRAAADVALTVVETVLSQRISLWRRPAVWWTGWRVER